MPEAVHNLSLAFEATRYFNLITDGVNGGSVFEPVILQPGETKDLSFLSLKVLSWLEPGLAVYTIHYKIEITCGFKGQRKIMHSYWHTKLIGNLKKVVKMSLSNCDNNYI